MSDAPAGPDVRTAGSPAGTSKDQNDQNVLASTSASNDPTVPAGTAGAGAMSDTDEAKAARFDAALASSQAEERREQDVDLVRQTASDERIVAALSTRT